MRQNAITAFIPILPARLPSLRSYLEEIGSDIENNPHVRFRETPSTHFARWVILDQQQDIRPRLYFSACYDGEFYPYLAELTSKLGKGMEAIWSCCDGYISGSASTAEEFASFLDPHLYQPGIFLIAFPGLTASQILQNAKTREQVESALDTIQGKLLSRSEPLPWVTPTAIQPHTGNPSKHYFQGFLAKLIDWSVGVRPGAATPNTRLTTQAELVEIEDMVVQNQMTIISKVKPGLWPRLLLRFFLYIGRSLDKASSTGQFSGLSTIHFARWVLIDNGENLLFESNYDGSWESYIDDFGDHAAVGMNAVWGNCLGFPKGGCLDIESFKQVIRANQHPAQVFYSAYPNQTVANIAHDLNLSDAVRSASQFASGSYV